MCLAPFVLRVGIMGAVFFMCDESGGVQSRAYGGVLGRGFVRGVAGRSWACAAGGCFVLGAKGIPQDA